MGKVYLDEEILEDIADSIRTKSGESGTMTPAEMPTEIANIPGYEVVDDMRLVDISFSNINHLYKVDENDYSLSEISKVENYVTLYENLYKEDENNGK